MSAPMAKALAERISEIPTVEVDRLLVIPDFGMFIDTHRDHPHVGSFHDDIHRGMCRPTKVHYIPAHDGFYSPEHKTWLPRHEKHLFLTEEFWAKWLTDYVITNGSDPRDGDGILPTSHFRDPRKKIYEVESFRQIVMNRWAGLKLGIKP